jgi:hypothetical protein
MGSATDPVVTDDTVIESLAPATSSSGMGKLHVILFCLYLWTGVSEKKVGCANTQARKDMHCYAEKHNAMHVMVTWRATLDNQFPLPSLAPFFFFEISHRVLKIVGVSVTYRVMCLFGAGAGASEKVTYKYSECEQYDS